MPGVHYASGPGRWVIAATVLGSGMAALDATVVGIALTAIGGQFHTGLASLQWVVTAYTLTLAALLLLGGDLGDRYGRRSVFVVGVVWFAVASLLCGVAPNAGTLIGARALQGVGAALLTPGSLAIIQASFVPPDRARAVGAWSGLGGVATAIGPFLGGWLISAVSWRLIFLINLPVAAAVALIAIRHVPESRDPGAGGALDVRGAVLVTAGLCALVFGLIEGPVLGWTAPATIAVLVASGFLLAAFVFAEARRPEPMLPLTLFRSRQFTATNAATFLVYAALGGALFLLPIQLEQVAGYSPLEAGTALLPVTALMLVLSARSGALAARIGPRLQMTVGPIVAGGGMALMARIGSSGSYAGEVLPSVVVLGLGLSITVAPLTATVLAAAPDEHTGIASAVNNDVARTGSLLAVAVLPVLAGITGDSYLQPHRFSNGFHAAVLIAAVACAAGGVLAGFLVRNPVTRERETAETVHCALEATPLREARDGRAMDESADGLELAPPTGFEPVPPP